MIACVNMLCGMIVLCATVALYSLLCTLYFCMLYIEHDLLLNDLVCVWVCANSLRNFAIMTHSMRNIMIAPTVYHFWHLGGLC